MSSADSRLRRGWTPSSFPPGKDDQPAHLDARQGLGKAVVVFAAVLAEQDQRTVEV